MQLAQLAFLYWCPIVPVVIYSVIQLMIKAAQSVLLAPSGITRLYPLPGWITW